MAEMKRRSTQSEASTVDDRETKKKKHAEGKLEPREYLSMGEYLKVDENAMNTKTVQMNYERVGDGTMYVFWLDGGDGISISLRPVEKLIESPKSNLRDNLRCLVSGIHRRACRESDGPMTKRRFNGELSIWHQLFMVKPVELSSEEFELFFMNELKEVIKKECLASTFASVIT